MHLWEAPNLTRGFLLNPGRLEGFYAAASSKVCCLQVDLPHNLDVFLNQNNIPRGFRRENERPVSVGDQIQVLHFWGWTLLKTVAFCKEVVPWQFNQMGVSKNRGTPKWMVYNGKPY